MSVAEKGKGSDLSLPAEKNKRRFLSPEKKYQIFLEAQRGEAPVGELLRREGLYSTDLARIQRKVKEGALEHLAQRPGRSKKTVSEEEYERLKVYRLARGFAVSGEARTPRNRFATAADATGPPAEACPHIEPCSELHRNSEWLSLSCRKPRPVWQFLCLYFPIR